MIDRNRFSSPAFATPWMRELVPVRGEPNRDPLIAWQAIRQQIQQPLNQVEQLLLQILGSQYPQVTELAVQAASLGGKRLRPCLTLLSAMACGGHSDDAIRCAATVELVHAASLVHDDVLDGAQYRRHQATLHQRIGIHDSIVVGDYLFTRAYATAAQCRSTYAARAVASAATSLCEGELMQQRSVGNWQMSIKQYLRILRQKTGDLCAVSCRLGAWSAGADATTAYALSRFGRKLGIAFQIMDDWLDVWGTSRVGKTLGTDLQQRKPTLPTLHLMRALGSCREEVLRLLDQLPTSAEAVRSQLDACGSGGYTLRCAERLVVDAVGELNVLRPSIYRDCLQAAAILAIQRNA